MKKSKRKKRVQGRIIVPSQWTIYDLHIDAEEFSRLQSMSAIPDGVLLEALVGMDKAKRRVVTGFHASESIELEADEGDEEFLGGDDGFGD